MNWVANEKHTRYAVLWRETKSTVEIISHGALGFTPRYRFSTTVLMISHHSTDGILQKYLWYLPTGLIVFLYSTEQALMYW